MSTSPRPQSKSDKDCDRPSGLLDQLAAAVRPISNATFSGRELVKEFVAQFLEGNMTIARDAEMMVNARIAQIDHLVSIQLNEVMHHVSFQKLEATWRGLDYLVRRSGKLNSVKIRVFNASKKEIANDFQQAPEMRTATVASQVWETALETYGGEPFSALISNFSFGPGPEDQSLLDYFRRLGSWAHVPFIGTAAPEFLGRKSFASHPTGIRTSTAVQFRHVLPLDEHAPPRQCRLRRSCVAFGSDAPPLFKRDVPQLGKLLF